MLPRRPIGVSILAFLQILRGLSDLLIMLLLLDVSSIAQDKGEKGIAGLTFLIAIVYLAIGLYSFWLARGYVKGYEWARRIGIKIAMFSILLTILATLFLPALAPDSPFWSIVFDLIIIAYLRGAKAKRFFESRSAIHGR
jgi:hypothetical protein